MKKLIRILILCCSIAISCKKEAQNPQDTSTVSINGNTYKTLAIGNQIWTIENYSGSGGIASSNLAYGKLYTYDEANAVPLPKEWRLPSADDYRTLMLSIGATKNANGQVSANSTITQKLMSTTGWKFINGNNGSGFNATPAGYYESGLKEGGETFRAWTTSYIGSGSNRFDLIFDLSTDSSKDAWAGLADDKWPGYRLSLRFVRNK